MPGANMKPLVSVLMPTYNDAPFLRMAIDSILAQTFSDFELIIINDASTDATSTILESYRDPRIIRLDNSTHLKRAATKNRGLAIAKGQFVAIMDGDDISDRERFEKQILFMEEHPDIGVLSTAMRLVNQQLECITTWSLPQTHNELMLRMLFSNPASHGTTMMRRDTLQKVHGYNEAYDRAEDTELWTRMCKETRFHSLPDILYQYRVTSDYKKKWAERPKIADVVRRHFIEELINENITENDYANFLLGQTAHPTKILTTGENFAALHLLFTAYDALKTKGYFSGDLSAVHEEITKCIVRIMGHSSGLKQLLPELFRFSASCSLAKYYWFNNNNFPKGIKWLGYGITSPKDFFSELSHHGKKKQD
jgi:glycosyltransferase involved in cell wall biosynthesis